VIAGPQYCNSKDQISGLHVTEKSFPKPQSAILILNFTKSAILNPQLCPALIETDIGESNGIVMKLEELRNILINSI